MSSTKKSLGSLVLLILIFLGIAGGSWYFFNHKSAEIGANEEEITESSDNANDILASEFEDEDTTEAEEVDENHDGHGHSATTNDTSGQIGQTAQQYDLSIKPQLGHRGVGDPNAPVQIREFFSLTCNHCADFHTGTYQALKSQLIDTGKVYFIYEEFPLNGPALYGSMIARCLPKERYTGFIDILLRTQDKWAFSGDFKESLRQNAKLAGMSDEEFDSCFANQELQKEIAMNIKEASDAWKISSTPTFVVNNGERVLSGGQSIDTFEKLVNELATAPANKE